jgi:membrane protease YdiL (CAAX protease family)
MARFFITPDRRLALFWRVLLYVVLFFAVALASNAIGAGLRRLGLPGVMVTPVFAVTYISGLLGMTYLYRRRVDRRDWRGMALPPPSGRWRDLAGGFLFGGMMMAVVFGVEVALGWVRVLGTEVATAGLSNRLLPLPSDLFSLIAIGFSEELAFRGYLLQNLGERYPIWLAAVVSGVIFGAIHFLQSGFNLMFVLSATILTVFLALSRLQTQAIWWAIGWHTGWNWIQISVLGLSTVGDPDFGRALLHLEQRGPALWVGKGFLIEGGLLCILVIALGAVLMGVWARRSQRLVGWRTRFAEDGSINQYTDAHG